MYVAMNRFRVVRGREAEFEDVWRNRQSRLDGMPGFRAFHLLRGPQAEDHVLYASQTLWDSFDAFRDWTRSERFRAAHKDAGQSKALYLAAPEFEGFEAVLSEEG